MPDSLILGPAQLAVGDGTTRYGRIAISGGRIADVLEGSGPSDIPVPSGATITPGLIDVHTNGADDHLFLRDQAAAVGVASAFYARCGATGFVASIMTAPWESMLHAGSAVAEAAHELEETGPLGARCLGLQFEGPFLNPKFRRVHRAEWLLPATMDRVRSAVEACRGALVMMAMAPEVEGVADAARWLHAQGIVCAAAHTSAKYAEGVLAIGVGFRTLTHAFNGMGPLDHREPSLLPAFIEDSRTTIQFICDGMHVAPPTVNVLYRACGDRLVIASDNMPPMGPDYHIEGGVMRAGDGTIAGSALRVDQGVRNLMAFAHIPFERAVIAGTAAPARLLGLDREMGTIAPGRRADLAIWDSEYRVVATLLAGMPVYGADYLDARAAS
ncbi:MAG: amidohydrolase family protein [bacterium]|nr:amidohydrolase family protein [bacterium]